jgi:hypothetical protein
MSQPNSPTLDERRARTYAAVRDMVDQLDGSPLYIVAAVLDDVLASAITAGAHMDHEDIFLLGIKFHRDNPELSADFIEYLERTVNPSGGRSAGHIISDTLNNTLTYAIQTKISPALAAQTI